MKQRVYLIDITDFVLGDGTVSTDWFREAFERLGLADGIDLVACDGTCSEFPEPEEVTGTGRGVIITGSAGPVYEEKDWIPPLLDFIRLAHGRNAWILGICFGHHALAVALGGKVLLNPRGREMGTVPVYLTPEGGRSRLFGGFRSGDPVNLVHRTHVAAMPEGAVRLAFNRMTPTQAFGIGRSFGYQGHPEMTPVQLEQLTRMYAGTLVGKERFLEDMDHLENFVTTFRDTPSSRAILGNFVSMLDQ